MSDPAKRQFVMDLYDGPAWKRRVKKMSDAQVFAIWKREQDKTPKKTPKRKESGDDGEAPF